MQNPTIVIDYINTVCEQIRWKKAHDNIKTELINHIEDQTSAYLEQNISKEQAYKSAIEQMGDPIKIGAEYDRVYRPKTNWVVVVITFILLIVGVLLRQFISDYSVTDVNKYIIATLIGTVLMISAYFFDYSKLTKYPLQIYILHIILLIVGLFVLPKTNGKVYQLEFLTLIFPAIYAGIIYLCGGKKIKGLVFCGFVAVLTMFIFLQIPSILCAIISAICVIIMITFAISVDWFKCNKKIALCLLYIPTVLCFFAFGYLHFRSVSRDSYISDSINKILSGAKFFGPSGFDNANNILPEMETNYMLVNLADSVGWIVPIAFILVVAVLIFFGIRLCIKQTSFSGKLVTIAVVSTIGLQAINYISANLGILRISVLPIPFIYGDTSIILNMFLMGLLLSVTRYSKITKDKAIKSDKSKAFEYVNGKIIIDLKQI